MNEKNLIPNNQRTPSQLREQARNAGTVPAETILSIQASAKSTYKYSSESLKTIAEGCSQDGFISVKHLKRITHKRNVQFAVRLLAR